MSNIRLTRERVIFLATNARKIIEENRQERLQKIKAQRERVLSILKPLLQLKQQEQPTNIDKMFERIFYGGSYRQDLDSSRLLKTLAENTEDGYVWVGADHLNAVTKYAPTDKEQE